MFCESRVLQLQFPLCFLATTTDQGPIVAAGFNWQMMEGLENSHLVSNSSMYSHVLTYVGVSIHGRTPKWMVHNRNSYKNGWFRATFILGNFKVAPYCSMGDSGWLLLLVSEGPLGNLKPGVCEPLVWLQNTKFFSSRLPLFWGYPRTVRVNFHC